MYEIQLREVLLRPEAVLGTPAPGTVPRRVSFGEWAGEFDSGLAPSEEWQQVVRAAGPVTRFRHLSIACSFGPEGPDEPGRFDEAQLWLEFGGDGQRPPVARAIHPLKQEGPTYQTPMSTISVGASFAGASVNVGGQRAAGNGPKWAIVGFGLHQPTPYWQFRPVPPEPLFGTYVVHVLVELGDGSKPVAQVTLNAKVMHRNRFRWYHGQLDGGQREISLG